MRGVYYHRQIVPGPTVCIGASEPIRDLSGATIRMNILLFHLPGRMQGEGRPSQRRAGLRGPAGPAHSRSAASPLGRDAFHSMKAKAVTVAVVTEGELLSRTV